MYVLFTVPDLTKSCPDLPHPDILLNKVSWLDSLGIQTRSKRNEKLENFLTEMQRLTLRHETDSHGESMYRFSTESQSKNDEADAGAPSEHIREDIQPCPDILH